MSRKYKLGDMWRDDFDYDGMIKMGLKTNSTWSISDLQKLYDSMEDVNYHTANKYLGSAIFALENDLPDVADIKFEKFHKELRELEEDDLETDGDYKIEKVKMYRLENGKKIYFDGWSAKVFVDGKEVTIPAGQYDTKEEIEDRCKRILEEVKQGKFKGFDLANNKFLSKQFKKGGQVKRSKYGDGESVENGNLEMMKNQAIQVQHHAEELIEILKSSPRVDAWVVSLMDRATQNLSNITHYLDGELKHFAKGGKM